MINASTVNTMIATKTTNSMIRYVQSKQEMFFQAPRNPTSDMRKITPPRAMTGMVKDRLHSSLWVLIQNPKPTTSSASIMVKKLIHLMTNALALPILLRPSLPPSQISRTAAGSCAAHERDLARRRRRPGMGMGQRK
uniref:Uncharacterized protein n=1 Tax=Arundo donax TaxID=35708 RepID=A0A0A9EWW0_ARUDO